MTDFFYSVMVLISDVFERIVFVQFATSVLVLCETMFLLSLVKHELILQDYI